MSDNNPFVSIITVVFNAESTLGETIESVLRQSYKNYEYIIVDGASTDGTLDLLKSYDSPRIRFISEVDFGIYDAMNKGLILAKGEWIYFLGADDVLHSSNVLEAIFAEHDCSCHDVLYGDVLLKHRNETYGGEFTSGRLMRQNICHQAIFYNASVFRKFGVFDLKYKMLADWEFNMRWFPDDRIKRNYLGLIVATYNERGGSSQRHDENFGDDYWSLLNQYFSSPIEILKIIISRLLSKFAGIFCKNEKN